MVNAIKAVGLQEVIDSFRSVDGILDREGRSFLRDMGNYGVLQSQKHILSAGAVDTNELVQGMHYGIDNTFNGMQVTVRPSDKADEYAFYNEEGSPPHKAPISALQGWADRHGIPVGAVWYKIATEGTDPRYWARDTFEDFKDETDKEAPRFVDAILRRL